MDHRATFLADVLAGLSSPTRSIPGKYLWDEEGSRIFEAITAEPGYYQTAAEFELILTGKRLGFTLSEIFLLMDAANSVGVPTLPLSKERVASQLETLSRKRDDVEKALAELRLGYSAWRREADQSDWGRPAQLRRSLRPSRRRSDKVVNQCYFIHVSLDSDAEMDTAWHTI